MLLSLLASPLARRLLGAALVFAALAAIVFSIYHAGKHAGAADEASRQVAAGKSSFERIEADVHARLDAASAHEQQLAALAEKLSADSAAASARAAAAQSAAATDRTRISALSDAALRSDLAARLGLSESVIPSGVTLSGAQSRNPSASLQATSAQGSTAREGNSPLSNSARPGVSPTGSSVDSKSRDDLGSAAASALSSHEALRAIDARLSDCEHLAEQTAALTQQVAALTARDSARESQLTAVTSERDAALDAYNQLVPLYAQAFRAATHRRRRWFCLFVCSTGPRLNLPPPLSVPASNASPAVTPRDP